MRKRINVKQLLFIAFTFGMVATLSFFLARSINSAKAANLANFRAGNIISDEVMGDYTSMSVGQIQEFLKSKNSCNDTRTYIADWYPQVYYHIENGHFVCMADETFNGKSAAQIIYDAAQTYHINPKVLIVLLEKENGLVTDTFPHSGQYNTATGFGCPDNILPDDEPCDRRYTGFENQIYRAAELFNEVLTGGWSNYNVGWNEIKYYRYENDENTGEYCGSSQVYIENRATASLYRYTPYQPNGASLAAGYGGGVSCGAYGNRNFYLYFTDWFGEGSLQVAHPNYPNISIDNGIYEIRTTDNNLTLELETSDNIEGTNVRIGSYTGNDTQRFRIIRQSDGYYRVANVSSGLSFDVANASFSNGANIWGWSDNSTCAQKWAINLLANGNYTLRNVCSGKSLDIANANMTSGTNVWSWDYNETIAQQWKLVRIDGAITIPDAIYSISTTHGKVFDVQGASDANGANLWIHHKNSTVAQIFEVRRDVDGLYVIRNTTTGKVLDVANAGTANGTNIWMWSYNGSCAQKWNIRKRGEYYSIDSVCTNKVIDVANGRVSSPDANLWLWDYNGSNAQLFSFTDVDQSALLGNHEIIAPSGFSMDVANAGTENGTNLWLWPYNGSVAQEYNIAKTDDGYFVIKNLGNNKVLDLAYASADNRANIWMWSYNGSCAQKWFFIPYGDKYTIRSACSGKALEVADGYITTWGANIQQYHLNHTPAQLWTIREKEE